MRPWIRDSCQYVFTDSSRAFYTLIIEKKGISVLPLKNVHKLFNPAFDTWGIWTPQYFLNAHNLEIIILFAHTFQLLSYLLKGV